MEKRIFGRYFALLALSYIITTLIISSTVYIYYDHMIEKRFIHNSKDRQKETMAIVEEFAKDKTTASKMIEEFAKKNRIVYLNIYDSNKNSLYTLPQYDSNNTVLKEIYETDSTPFSIQDLDKDRIGKSKLTRMGEEYLFWFMYPNNNPDFTSIGAILVDEDLQDEMDGTIEAIFLSTTLTSIVIAIVIFPIIFLAYKELLLRKKRLLKSYVETIEALGNAIAKRDSDTNSHNFRVTWYSVKIAEAIGLEKERMAPLIMGAFLHDIGKIAIRDSILLKPGKLDSEEFEVMKTHVKEGADILKGIDWLEDAKKVVLQHHERVDGKGYPNGLGSNEITVEAKIFAIVDVFDALTSKRPYKEPIPLEKAISMMEEEVGTHFDSEIFKAFKNIAQNLYSRTKNADISELKHLLRDDIEIYFDLVKHD